MAAHLGAGGRRDLYRFDLHAMGRGLGRIADRRGADRVVLAERRQGGRGVKRPFELNISGLPTYGFGTRMTTWWGTLAFCVLEGTGFALGAAAYLYLWLNNPEWPIETGPPRLLWGSLVLFVMLASLWPNLRIERHARDEN